MLSRISFAVALLPVAVHLALSPAAAADAPSRPVETTPTAELEAACERLRSGRNPYFGRGLAEELERRLGTPIGDPAVRVGVRGRLAEELLRLGDPERAVELLEEARGIVEAAELAPELRHRLLYLLGLAWMQVAEERNCVAMHGARSCILPFAPEALHRDPEPARWAAEHFLRLLAEEPGEIQARWLLVLAWRVSGGDPEALPEAFRPPAGAFASEVPFPRWSDRAPELGTDAFDLAGGAVMDDFDGDGLLDLVTSTWDPCDGLEAFRNDGRGGFEEVTEEWGLGGQLGALNLVHGDFDGDGRLDLLALRGGWLGDDGRIRNSLLANHLGDADPGDAALDGDSGGGGRFLDVTAAAGLAYPAYPTQTAAWADYDGDGDLDLYVGNESSTGRVYSWQLARDPGRAFPSQLFHNHGDGTFTDVARSAGATNDRFTKGVAWGDYDDDGDPDLYLSNLGANRLYRNDGAGDDGRPRFTDVAPELGVTGPGSASFATWFFDYDNDGDLDLFVADYGARVRRVSASYLGLGEAGEPGHPVLYRNDGGRFTDVSRQLGFVRPLLPMGANYGDLDGDGWLDLVLGTGVPDLEALMPDVAYRNDGGRRFVDVTFAGGFGHLQKGHGVAFGDLDNDGDQDLLHQMGGAFPADGFANALYENPTRGRRWLTLRLRGRHANRFGIGARIEVTVGEGEGRRAIHRRVGSGGSFGGSSLQQEIGLGNAREIVSVTVRWPGSGTVQRFSGVALDRCYLADEERPELIPLDPPRIRLGGAP